MTLTSDHSNRLTLHPVAWLLSLCLFTLPVIGTYAQLIEAPLPAPENKRPDANARTHSTGPLRLPFWDDFSTVAPGYPDTLWIHSNSVYISNGIGLDRKSTRLNSSHVKISYAVFC